MAPARLSSTWLCYVIIHTRLLRTHRLLRPCTALVASWPYLSGLTYVETCSYLCSGIVVFFLRLVATTVDLENGLTVTFCGLWSVDHKCYHLNRLMLRLDLIPLYLQILKDSKTRIIS